MMAWWEWEEMGPVCRGVEVGKSLLAFQALSAVESSVMGGGGGGGRGGWGGRRPNSSYRGFSFSSVSIVGGCGFWGGLGVEVEEGARGCELAAGARVDGAGRGGLAVGVEGVGGGGGRGWSRTELGIQWIRGIWDQWDTGIWDQWDTGIQGYDGM